MEIEEVLIVDIDNDNILRCQGSKWADILWLFCYCVYSDNHEYVVYS